MDVIKVAARALKPISERGITVSQAWYNEDLKTTHVALTNLGEMTVDFSDDDEEIIKYPIQISVFSTKDEYELLKEIKKLMKNAGFYFTERMADDIGTKERRFMQAMRFEIYEESEEQENA